VKKDDRKLAFVFSLWFGAILMNGLWLAGARICDCWNSAAGPRRLSATE
jgi:hypothetical protein